MAELHADLLPVLTQQAQVELSAHVLYLQAAYWFEDRKLTGIAKYLKKEAEEEHAHFKQVLDYIVLRGHQSEIAEPTVAKREWRNEVEVVRSILEAEEGNYESLVNAAKQARTVTDYDGERFVQSMLKEQVDAVYSTKRFFRQVESFTATPGLIWWLNEQLE